MPTSRQAPDFNTRQASLSAASALSTKQMVVTMMAKSNRAPAKGRDSATPLTAA
jgi:hypothetical protein